MSRIWKAQEIAQATKGKTTGDWSADSVSIDTRTLKKGALFVALKGEKADGHEYVAEALKKGAAGALVSRAVAGVDAAKLVMVQDVQRALEALGMAARAQSAAKFIGVTGSVGKTGAKEMLGQVLQHLGKTFISHGNFNGQIGVPINLAAIPQSTEYAVMEMGMSQPGEMGRLSQWVKPNVALITTVEAVHLEYFKNIDGIADEKAAVFDGMGGAGIAVLNADNAQYARLKKQAEAKGLDRVLSFGTRPQANCRMLHYKVEDMHSVVEAMIAGTKVEYRIGAIGKHWALMSVAVLAIVDALGGDVAKAAASLQHFTEPKGRGQIKKLAMKGGHLKLIDDSYNASPVSMQGAFEKARDIKNSDKDIARTVVVLGDMLELGEASRELHVGLVPALINNQMDLVFAAGTFMQSLFDALPEAMRGEYRKTSQELAPVVVKALQARDLVLVKGSRGSRMDAVVEAIEENADAI